MPSQSLSSLCLPAWNASVTAVTFNLLPFYHSGLLPLDDDIVIFVGAPFPGQPFTASALEAFYVPKGTFVKLNPLLLHGTQFPLQADTAHVVCMLPGRTFRNDMVAERLTEEMQIRIRQ